MEVFEGIFKEYYQPLTAYTRQIVKQDDVAADIVTDSFLKLLNLKNWDSPQSYLYTCCRNAALDYLRSKKIHKRHHEEILILPTPESLEYDELYYIYIQEINKALNKVSPRRKQIFIRLFKNGESVKETAKALNISIQTVRNHKIKVIERLHTLLFSFHS